MGRIHDHNGGRRRDKLTAVAIMATGALSIVAPMTKVQTFVTLPNWLNIALGIALLIGGGAWWRAAGRGD